MRCPVCTDVTLLISSREGIEIDHCPDCRGVWLDRGELDKIIDRSAPAAPEPRSNEARRPPDDRYEDRGRYDEGRGRYDERDRYTKRKRRGSFLEELFDFD